MGGDVSVEISTFFLTLNIGANYQDYSKSGSKILDFVTLKKDSKSAFSGKGRF